MKRCLLLFLAAALLLSGCGSSRAADSRQYTVTYLNFFDTVTTIVATDDSEEAFLEKAGKIYSDLLFYHRLFNIYKTYEGLNNLKTINDQAGLEPVKVDPAIIQLLLFCREAYHLTGGKVNAAMGSVLQLWHEARQDGVLPDQAALDEAALHTDFSAIEIDENACTVFISDPATSLDVGAIAKGWAAQQVAQAAPEGMIISVGGNVCVTGAKDSDGTPWVIGVQDPDHPDQYVQKISMTQGAAVTSGDYQRVYTVEGKTYHHIIDPTTNMPAEYWRSVTVVCSDSGLADVLSTALFLLPLSEGMALAEAQGVQAFWLDASGNSYMTTGFQALIP